MESPDLHFWTKLLMNLSNFSLACSVAELTFATRRLIEPLSFPAALFSSMSLFMMPSKLTALELELKAITISETKKKTVLFIIFYNF